MKLLVIEDDKRIARVLEQGLTEDGHNVFLCHRGDEGLELIQSQYFEVIVLDVMLPGCDGFQILKQTRQAKCSVPILMLTARDSMPEIVHGLDLGADDYLTKPFQLEVLLARVRAMGRRGQVPLLDQLKVGGLVLDRGQKRLLRGEDEIPLTRKEFMILELLMRRPQQVVSRNELIEAGWGFDAEVSDNSIDFYMHSLRSKINVQGQRSLIRTVRAQGYALHAAS
ncbi:DNA-binding response OmpR family regulator [Granulicella aggregans]|uniref:DNA-binding response OmpR family regulator n=1 Tax=Granulicella aggregans TaxID=474949 RepID=A0A7W8E588_9BACT|nr:response regulator transcription factor [Granulicella aggregans]MBB5059417.1 DNA-binding response OmpR family regulator [Granulicella aggregans]